MRASLKYFWYLLRHKWFVFREACKLGIPWRGLVHDLSKFLPSEWTAYRLSFYGAWCYEARPQWLMDAFNLAWLKHQHRNPHHWQHWLLVNDSDSEQDGALPMPDVYRREMLADWRGCGRALGKPDTAAWYRANARKIRLHPETRRWIEQELGISP